MPRDLVLVREKWSHHSSTSGFDPLAEALKRASAGSITSVEVRSDAGPRSFFKRAGKRLRSVVSSSAVPVAARGYGLWTEPSHHDAATKAIRLARSHPNALIVLMAGENQLSSLYVDSGPEIRSRLVVVLHQPPAWMRLHWRDMAVLNGLRAVVALCESQSRWMSTAIDSPVLTIKHGVRHDVFRPLDSGESKTAGAMLFVGQWLRDFATLEATLPSIWARRPEATLDCVVPRQARREPCLLRIANDERVRWHADLGVDQLCRLYQRAEVLLLPLIDATANNAIGEALASGLPIVASKTGGAVDYVPEGAGTLCPRGDAAAHASAAIDWLGAGDRQANAAEIGRRFATTHLDWDAIARGLADALQ
jgi:glycosyltransferase involved in cell wall biosynthesis